MIYRLDDPLLTTAALAVVRGTTEKNCRNWMIRLVAPLRIGQLNVTGRHEYTLLDGLKVAVVQDLVARTGMGPATAIGAATVVARYVADHAPRDPTGRPLADANSVGSSVACILALVDGET